MSPAQRVYSLNWLETSTGRSIHPCPQIDIHATSFSVLDCTTGWIHILHDQKNATSNTNSFFRDPVDLALIYVPHQNLPLLYAYIFFFFLFFKNLASIYQIMFPLASATVIKSKLEIGIFFAPFPEEMDRSCVVSPESRVLQLPSRASKEPNFTHI